MGKVNPKEELPEGTPGLLGGMFAVWNDHCGNGVSQQDVHFRTFPAAQVLAEKMWRGKNEMVSYEEFEELCKQMPEAPGVNLLGRVQGEVVLPGQNEELSLNGTDSIATMLPEVGYPYVVEFEINPDKDQNINGICLKVLIPPYMPIGKIRENWLSAVTAIRLYSTLPHCLPEHGRRSA